MATIYLFGPFRLDVEAEMLSQGMEPVGLGRRAVALLRMLVERPGVPVSKDALIEGAWPGLAVEENNLTVQIGALRRVLGEAGGASWIETMPRRGYRFVGPAVATEQNTEAAGLPPAVSVVPERPSIAVLPFANMSGDPGQEHLADGMTEDIITALSKLRWLPVVARNSTFVYKGAPVSIKQVGADLGVRFVLEGSVRKSGDWMRVTGQLIESGTGEHLWAEHYDRQIGKDLFAVQDQITRHVVTAIDSVVRAVDSRDTGQRPAKKFDGENAGRTPSGDPERRQLTVMCCELVRSATRRGVADLEDLREAVGGFQRCVADIVGIYKGFPGHHVGSTVLIYFGYPAAYEDDAEQAVRAGLELCVAVQNLSPKSETVWHCRVGIATGLVIVGDLAGGAEAPERGIIGETPNVATQLQALAQPNTVMIDSTTRRLIGNLFDCRDLGTVEMTGAAEPLPTWQVLRASALESRFEALRSADLAPLVGRDEELDMLRRRWREAVQGEGRVVLISGEPGIGKSRLTVALQELVRAEGHAHIRYFCAPHRKDSPLHPVTSHIGQIAGFAGDDGPDQRLDKLAAILAAAGLADGDISLIAEFMSLPAGARYPLLDVSPQRRKERTLAALLRQLEGLARRQPLLITFEDLHWIDPTSCELLDLLVERIDRLPILLAATCRPEFQRPWADLPHVTFAALRRLGRNDGAAIVRRLCGDVPLLPQDLVNEIVTRADGVPLFVEELTKAVLESGADQSPELILAAPASRVIPASLQASLMARLDRLGLAARQVAQVGAAIGREFAYPLLTAAAQLPESSIRDGLEKLIDASLVFQRGSLPHASYVFKHALIQDIVYTTMLRQPRQTLHGNIAAALEQHFPDRAASEPEMLAQHFAEAGLNGKAASYLLRAGRLAIRRSAMTEAVAQLQKGLELISDTADDAARHELELDLQIALGLALIATKGYTAPESDEAYTRARQLSKQLNQPRQLGPVLGGQFAFRLTRGELAQAERHAEEIRRLAGSDPMWKYAGAVVSGNVSFYLGKFVDARAYFEQALSLWDPAYRAAAVVPEDPYVVCLTFLSRTLACLGYVDQARERRNEAVTEARQLSPFNLAFALSAAWQVDWAIEREKSTPAMLQSAEELLAISNEHGFGPWLATGNIMRGWCLGSGGQAEEGIPTLLEGIAAVGARGGKLVIPFYLTILADAYRTAAQPAQGLGRLADAARLVETTRERWAEAEMHRLRGTLLLSRNEHAAAEDSFRDALMVARQQSAKLWELRAALDIARLLRSRGKRNEAREMLGPVCDWFTEGSDIPVLQEARTLLDQLP